jgi:hypothetical protein
MNRSTLVLLFSILFASPSDASDTRDYLKTDEGELKTRFAAKKAWSRDALEKAGDGEREDHGIKSKGKHAVQQR